MKRSVLTLFLAFRLAGAMAADSASSPTNDPLKEAESTVEQAYRDILRRNPDSGGMATFVDYLVNQGKDKAWLRKTLRESEEGGRIRAERRRAVLVRTAWGALVVVALVLLGSLVIRFRLGKQVLLMGGTGLAALLVLEVAVRLLQPRSSGAALSGHDRSRIFYEIAPERQHPTPEEAKIARRVAIVGDSFTRGVGVQIDDRFAAKLERMLNANAGARPVVVDVFDEPGTSTFQQLPLLEQALAKKPDLVLLSICLNDTEDWKRPHELHRWRAEGQPSTHRTILHSSRLLALAHAKIQLQRAKSGYIQYYRRLYDPEYTGWLRFAESVTQMRDACAGQGVSFAVLIHPLLSDPFAEGKYPFEFAHKAVHSHLRELGIPFVDTLSRLRGTLPIRMSAIPEIDPHPSEIAHRLTANVLFDFLMEQGCFGAEYGLQWRESERGLAARWQLASELMDPLAAPRK
jgi:hypothetical protein